MSYAYSKIEIPEDILLDSKLKYVNKNALSVLVNRGYSKSDINELLFNDMSLVYENIEMTDSKKAIELLLKALKNKEHIVVYRDYDCDGCSAGAVVMESMLNLKANITHYANDRTVDGYGLCVNGVKNILNAYPDTKTIITVDNGIVAYDGIDYAKSQGITVIVTDHHEQGSYLPNADAIVDPKRHDEQSQFHELCGAGVAFKLMLGLYQELNLNIEPVLNTLDIVALATIGDVVPLINENRVLVKEGLKKMIAGERLFFKELAIQLELKTISSKDEVGFKMAPIVNAVSRLGKDTNKVVDIMLSEDMEFVKVGIRELITNNMERKELTMHYQELAETIVENLPPDEFNKKALIIYDKNLHSGLVGIIAGRLKEKYNKPCVVLTEDGNEIYKGSIRGTDGFHIKKALDNIPNGIILKHGGHEKAAGMAIHKDNLEVFKQYFWKEVDAAYPENIPEEIKNIDLVISEEECTEDLIGVLGLLEPCGEGFPSPLIGLKANIVDVKYLGQEEKHVKYLSKDGISVIRWNFGEDAKRKKAFPTKFVGVPKINIWGNNRTVQFMCEN